MDEASQYYERESTGLGQAFLAEIERGTDEIIRNPAAGVLMQGAIRRRLIRGFPYALLYRATSSEIRILAMMNLKRRPAYWVGRM